MWNKHCVSSLAVSLENEPRLVRFGASGAHKEAWKVDSVTVLGLKFNKEQHPFLPRTGCYYFNFNKFQKAEAGEADAKAVTRGRFQLEGTKVQLTCDLLCRRHRELSAEKRLRALILAPRGHRFPRIAAELTAISNCNWSHDLVPLSFLRQMNRGPC